VTQNRDESDSTPVLRLGLKRVNLEERVFGDEDLAQSDFVRLAGASPLRAVLAEAVGRRFADQARLFLEGDPGDALILILKGEVRLHAGTGPEQVELGVARKAEVIGEGQFLGRSTLRCYGAQASGEVEVVELSRSLLERHGGWNDALRAQLEKVHDARKAAGAEMADFLRRW
jgi:CRP-like cAMP-binding protein